MVFYHEAINCYNSKNIYCIVRVTVSGCEALGWLVCLAELCWRVGFKFVLFKATLAFAHMETVYFLAAGDDECALKHSVVLDETHKSR